jgi:hypothetical protein
VPTTLLDSHDIAQSPQRIVLPGNSKAQHEGMTPENGALPWTFTRFTATPRGRHPFMTPLLAGVHTIRAVKGRRLPKIRPPTSTKVNMSRPSTVTTGQIFRQPLTALAQRNTVEASWTSQEPA